MCDNAAPSHVSIICSSGSSRLRRAHDIPAGSHVSAITRLTDAPEWSNGPEYLTCSFWPTRFEPAGEVASPPRREDDLTDAGNQHVTVVRAGALTASVGAAAINSLLAQVIAEEIAHSQKVYKFPANVNEETSIPLRERLLMPAGKNNFIPSQPTEEGDDLKLIFSVLLTVLGGKIQERMSQETIDN